MPDVIGAFWHDADSRLRALGWTGTLEKRADVPDPAFPRNCIVSQNPAAGTWVPNTVTVTLAFST
jgi:serine/threonine-protein kinase